MRTLDARELRAVSGGTDDVIVVKGKRIKSMDSWEIQLIMDSLSTDFTPDFGGGGGSFSEIGDETCDPQEDWGPPPEDDPWWDQWGEHEDSMREFMEANPDYPLNDPAYREHVLDLQRADAGLKASMFAAFVLGMERGGIQGAMWGVAGVVATAMFTGVINNSGHPGASPNEC